MRKEIVPEELFLRKIKRLIDKLLINNQNYNNGYYYRHNSMDAYYELLDDTKKRAEYILEEIENIQHLVLEK